MMATTNAIAPTPLGVGVSSYMRRTSKSYPWDDQQQQLQLQTSRRVQFRQQDDHDDKAAANNNHNKGRCVGLTRRGQVVTPSPVSKIRKTTTAASATTTRSATNTPLTSILRTTTTTSRPFVMHGRVIGDSSSGSGDEKMKDAAGSSHPSSIKRAAERRHIRQVVTRRNTFRILQEECKQFQDQVSNLQALLWEQNRNTNTEKEPLTRYQQEALAIRQRVLAKTALDMEKDICGKLYDYETTLYNDDDGAQTECIKLHKSYKKTRKALQMCSLQMQKQESTSSGLDTAETTAKAGNKSHTSSLGWTCGGALKKGAEEEEKKEDGVDRRFVNPPRSSNNCLGDKRSGCLPELDGLVIEAIKKKRGSSSSSSKTKTQPPPLEDNGDEVYDDPPSVLEFIADDDSQSCVRADTDNVESSADNNNNGDLCANLLHNLERCRPNNGVYSCGGGDDNLDLNLSKNIMPTPPLPTGEYFEDRSPNDESGSHRWWSNYTSFQTLKDDLSNSRIFRSAGKQFKACGATAFLDSEWSPFDDPAEDDDDDDEDDDGRNLNTSMASF